MRLAGLSSLSFPTPEVRPKYGVEDPACGESSAGKPPSEREIPMATNVLKRFNGNFSSGDQLGIYDVRENHSCFHLRHGGHSSRSKYMRNSIRFLSHTLYLLI